MLYVCMCWQQQFFVCNSHHSKFVCSKCCMLLQSSKKFNYCMPLFAIVLCRSRRLLLEKDNNDDDDHHGLIYV